MHYKHWDTYCSMNQQLGKVICHTDTRRVVMCYCVRCIEDELADKIVTGKWVIN